MKICVAQTRPIKGDIEGNIVAHKQLIDLAVAEGAGVIIFPELSLTGYEPGLAKELATDPDDSRLTVFQEISDTKGLTIGVGMPTKTNAGLCISMIIFQPHSSRQMYSKKYIHADEEPYFISGQNASGILGNNKNIALAICYELSIPQHAADAFENGAKIYIASVAETAAGVEKAGKRLSSIASTYSMTVLMSNCVGHCDNFESAGHTAIWNAEGVLLAQMNDTNEGILMIDTDSGEITEKLLSFSGSIIK